MPAVAPTKRPVPPRLIGVFKRRKHFLRKRRYAKAFADASYDKVASQLNECQETESLVVCHSCRGSWWITTRCRLRVCPLCSFVKAQERAIFIQAMCKEMKHPKLLTLTFPTWTDDPRAGIKLLRASFSRLRRFTFMRHVVGGAYQIELKQKTGGWHIHLHSIMDAPYLPYQKIFTAWKAITGVSVPQVDIRAASTPEAQAYAAKYASKSNSFDAQPQSIVAWYEATKGSRLFGTFGKWFNKTLADVLPDKFADIEPPRCPHCGAVKSAFLARDGPFIFGPELWHDIAQVMLDGLDDIRPIAGCTDLLANPSEFALPSHDENA